MSNLGELFSWHIFLYSFEGFRDFVCDVGISTGDDDKKAELTPTLKLCLSFSWWLNDAARCRG